jgi:hypothetical protein
MKNNDDNPVFRTHWTRILGTARQMHQPMIRLTVLPSATTILQIAMKENNHLMLAAAYSLDFVSDMSKISH